MTFQQTNLPDSSLPVDPLENKVNYGNFSIVSKVPNSLVAKKTLTHFENYQNKNYNEIFDSEVNIASKLDHRNIVKYYGFNKIDYCIYFEWMNGGTLDQFLMNSNGIAKTIFNKYPILLKEIALDIARGMAYLHGLDPPVFHRDLTTSNILLDNPITLNVDNFNTTCKISDFGLSRYVNPGDRLTTTFGNLPFVAPELLFRDTKKIGLKSDVYSFSIVLWKMFSFAEPYLDSNEKIECMVLRGVRPPTYMIKDDQWLELINKCWKSEPEHRPTFEEIITTIEKFN